MTSKRSHTHDKGERGVIGGIYSVDRMVRLRDIDEWRRHPLGHEDKGIAVVLNAVASAAKGGRINPAGGKAICEKAMSASTKPRKRTQRLDATSCRKARSAMVPENGCTNFARCCGDGAFAATTGGPPDAAAEGGVTTTGGDAAAGAAAAFKRSGRGL